ncbi:hypothetical protein CDAR_35801 [Caerostris darwini]|uniref:Uncharacterized protein n=1 Tax=Caerostris darwini TaxID=1538125 RepID=A0AAV4VCH0_9ARAC|nr:hypothetical protein CDAR_35801 [Caerostris darwini]
MYSHLAVTYTNKLWLASSQGQRPEGGSSNSNGQNHIHLLLNRGKVDIVVDPIPSLPLEEESPSTKTNKTGESSTGKEKNRNLNANSSSRFPNAIGMLICPAPGKIAPSPEKKGRREKVNSEKPGM